jgi:hypothetical protein
MPTFNYGSGEMYKYINSFVTLAIAKDGSLTPFEGNVGFGWDDQSVNNRQKGTKAERALDLFRRVGRDADIVAIIVVAYCYYEQESGYDMEYRRDYFATQYNAPAADDWAIIDSMETGLKNLSIDPIVSNDGLTGYVLRAYSHWHYVAKYYAGSTVLYNMGIGDVLRNKIIAKYEEPHLKELRAYIGPFFTDQYSNVCSGDHYSGARFDTIAEAQKVVALIKEHCSLVEEVA